MIKVITIATENKGYLNTLIEGCNRYNMDLTVLGMNEKWGGFIWKFKKIKEYLNNNLQPDDIVVFLDGYDTLCVDYPEKLYKNFLDYNTNILVSTDQKPKNFLHRYSLNKVFNTCNKVSINTGMYMGYVWCIKELLDMICEKYDCNDPELDDQRIFTELCNTSFFNQNIKIDTQKYCFLNIFPDKIYSPDIKEIPKIESVFISGPGNTNLDAIIELYKFKNKGERRTGYLFRSLKIYYKYFIPEIILILILMILIFRKLK